MKPSKTLTTTLLLCCLGAASHQALASRVDAPVRAKVPKPITLSSTHGFKDVEYIMGNYTHVQKVRIFESGTYALTLTDMFKPRALKKLGATLASKKGKKVARLTAGGKIVFDIDPGLYSLSYFAKTYNPHKPGKFRISLLQQETAVPEVPVPGALWLFGSGLLGLAGIKRHRF
ncbi:MAG: PEP-CTERM sorting domain-containing protein [Gammaproteobacteria bacterium]|nr:PEP-CTERM sorting domain-containing protein [Gammaproteobacteria bacterium]